MRRRFSDLRRSTESVAKSPEEPIDSVMRRVFSGGDGQRVLDWMIDRVSGPSPLNAPEAMVRDRDGQRRLVNDMLDLMTGRSATSE